MSWEAELTTRPTFPGTGRAGETKFVTVRRRLGPTAKNVTVAVEPAAQVRVVTGETSVARVQPGAVLKFMVDSSYTAYPNAVVVTCDGRFGRRTTWRSGL